jgi:ribonuclease BN (tRNA processing enzyme)
MKSDIIFHVIGNTSPFSLMGESSGYMVVVNGCHYLLECGAQVFPILGFHGIEKLKGIFATHSHEDHRRWFTDIVLFRYYDPGIHQKVRLISSEAVLEEFHKNSKGALERSLSHDSKRIVDVPYENMVEEILIGPRSKYFISLDSDESGGYSYRVKDRKGNIIGPEKAKIVINPKANRPRLLFKDDESREWVEPESYYDFSSTTFYEEGQNIFRDEEADLAVEAVKSSVWHGVPTVAYRFKTAKNSLYFSADTVYKPSLWKELCETHRPQEFTSVSRETFEERTVIMGDINDFIERTWSRERYEAALSAYNGSVVIHDVARKNSVVHTDYPDIGNAPIDNLIFTHSPDNLTARRPILKSGKCLCLRNGRAYETVDGRLYPFDADLYVKHFSSHLVGYRSEKGAYKVIEEEGLLGIAPAESPKNGIMRVDLYEDIGGKYFALLEATDQCYRLRPDGQVEAVTYNQNTSRGKLAQNLRGKIGKKGSL